MKILIGGGGTGGHIYPGLALARYARAIKKDNEILFVGTADGLENKIVPSAGFELATISARGLQRTLKGMGRTMKELTGGLFAAMKIIKAFKPGVVLGTGGYAAVPVVLAALLKKVPVVIHEQNALPGLANRLLAPFADRVCISFLETEKRLFPKSRIIHTGNPRSSEITVCSRKEGCRYFNLDPGKIIILIYGGSRGSLEMNRTVTAYLLSGLIPKEVNIIFVTGERYYNETAEKLSSAPPAVKLFPYLDEMPQALAAADLAITRSGATTLAELTVLGLPALLIPSPNVVNNHQYYNARILADAGAAILIDEKDFNRIRLQEEIECLVRKPELMKKMSQQSKIFAIPDAAARLYCSLEEVAS